MTETAVIPVMVVVEVIKKALYVSGALALYHRLRNRATLTVIVFHRVLDTSDPRWATSDPDYTVSTTLFGECLAFFRRHYTVVSLGDVLDARRTGRPLPERALLITFDDGWADNADYALPQLQRAQMPAVLFVVADVVGRRTPFFQERIYGAWRSGRLTTDALSQALSNEGVAATLPRTGDDEAVLRTLIAGLEALDVPVRERLLTALGGVLDDGHRHWLAREELHALEAGGFAIGMHGMTHVPMTRAPALDVELAGARAAGTALSAHGTVPVSMSFPHGRYDDAIARQAAASGYELVFTSVQGLNPTRQKPSWLLARCGFEAKSITDRHGRLRPDRLALYAFRLPRRSPPAPPPDPHSLGAAAVAVSD